MARENRKLKLVYKGTIEGLEEKLYFKRLELLINSKAENHMVSFKFQESEGGDPYSIAKRANKIVSFYGREAKQIY